MRNTPSTLDLSDTTAPLTWGCFSFIWIFDIVWREGSRVIQPREVPLVAAATKSDLYDDELEVMHLQLVEYVVTL